MYGNNLTPFQKDVYFEQALNPSTTLYSLLSSFELPANVDKSCLKKAVRTVVTQIEMLNTVVDERDDELVFSLKPLSDEAMWQEIQIKSVDELQAVEDKFKTLQYDLTHGPLFQVVYVYSESAAFLLLAGHHVQMDGTSYACLMDLIVAAYHDPSLKCEQQVCELIEYQTKLLSPKKQQKCIDYWRAIDFDAYSGVFDVGDKQIHHIETLSNEISPSQWAKINTVAKQQGVSLYQLLISMFALCVKRVFGKAQFSLGNVTRNRGTAKSKEMLGMMSSIFPVTFDTRGNVDVFALARDTAKQFNQSYRFQKLPLSTLVKSLPSQQKPFDILFNYLNLNGDFYFDGQPVLSRYVTQEDSSLPFTFDVNDFGGENAVECNVHFDASIIAPHLAGHLLTLFVESLLTVSATNHHYQSVLCVSGDMLSLSKGTADTQLFEQYPNTWSLFSQQFTNCAQQVALADGATEVTYGQLAQLVEAVSQNLIRQFPSQSVIGVHLPKGIEQIVAMLACFKANMIFVAMDPSQDDTRLIAIDEVLSPVLILTEYWPFSQTQQQGYQQLINLPAEKAHPTPLVSQSKPTDTAFILFTSGTTNKPKAVAMPHKGLVSLVLGQQDLTPELLNISRCLQFTSINFDVAVQEVLSTLCAGGQLVCISEQTRTSLADLLEVVVTQQVDTLFLPNTVLSQLLSFALEQKQSLPALKRVVTAGEALVIDKGIKGFFKTHPNCRLINHYGPTETHVATGFNLQADVASWVQRPPIGHALGYAQVAIINPLGEVAIKGLPGELYIAGEGVADGYWQQTELTSERFVSDVSNLDGRVYKSGDICRMAAQGEIDYIARAQQQVKVNGIRIDLTEIVTVAKSILGDKRIEVLQLPNSSTLVLAVEGEAVDEQSCLQALAQVLPQYMCPKQVISVDVFPTNINKKLDKPALLTYFSQSKNSAENIEHTALYKSLSSCWYTVLEAEELTQSSNFFDLGGHSLSATRLVALINQQVSSQFGLKHVFAAPTLFEQYSLLNQLQPTEAQSELQQRANSQQVSLWRFQQLNPGSCEYNLSSVYQLDDTINRNTLKQAIDLTIAAHPLLNTVFIERDGQVFIEKADKPTHWQNLAQGSSSQKTDAFLAQAFDLTAQTPVKVALFEEQAHTFIGLSFHHIAMDNRSLSLFKETLNQNFIALSHSEQSSECPEYAFEQVHYSDAEPTISYWQTRLGDMSGNVTFAPEFRLGRSKPNKYIDEQTQQLLIQIQTLAKQFQMTDALCWETVFAWVAHTYTSTPKINIGTPISLADADNQGVGYFVNTLPAVYEIDAKQSIATFFAKAKQARVKDLAHCDVDVLALNQQLHEHNNSGLFQIFVQWLDADPVNFELAGTAQSLVKTPDISRFDLAASIISDELSTKVQIDYNASLYSKAYVQNLVERIKLVVNNLVTLPKTALLADIEYLLPSEVATIDGQEVIESEFVSVMSQFWQMAERHKESVAINYQGTDYSYAWLSGKVKQLSHILELRNITVGEHVVVAMERTPMALVCQLAIWQQGLVYVPLLKSLPQQRKQFIVEKVQPALVLHDNHDTYGFDDYLVNEANLASETTPATVLKEHDVAYVLFTSGSTGEPKGVSVKQAGLAAMLSGLVIQFAVSHQDVMPSLGDLTFGVAFVECLLPLVAGGQCLMIPRNIQTNVTELIPALEKSTLIHFVPALARVVAQSNAHHTLNKVRYIFVGGDALNCALVKSLQASFDWAQIVEFYGQTEGTVLSTYCRSQEMTSYQESDNIIGQALPHAKLYILDKQLKPVPFGVTGDLHISGLGVAKGYFKNTALTQKQFVTQNGSDVLFNSGDRAKYTLAGHIQYLGREDFQINVNGYRIEPAEIEATLKRVSGSDICVVKWHEEAQVLAAYHFPVSVTEQEIKERLSQSLPSYMIPHRFVTLDSFPLNRNNKVDRKALELPVVESSTHTLIAQNTQQTQLFDLWHEVFGVPVGSLEESFFETGAHSLKATEFVSRFNHTFNAELTLAALFQQPQVGQILALLSAQPAEAELPIITPVTGDTGAMSAAQQRIWMLHQFDPQDPSYDKNIHLVLANAPDVERVQAALNSLLHRHETLRTIYPDSHTQQILLLSQDLVSVHTAHTQQEHERLVNHLKAQLGELRFDLTHDVPFCAHIVACVQHNEIHILFKTHHVATDGVSMQILASDLLAAYNGQALEQGETRYLDYSVWHRNLQVEEQVNVFWQSYLEGAPLVHELPLDTPRAANQKTHQGELRRIHHSPVVSQVAQSLKVTEYELLLSTFGYVLNRFANQQDVTIATPYHGRETAQLSEVVGCFINTVVTRIQHNEHHSLSEFIIETSNQIRAARDHANIGLEGLIELLEPPRNTSAMPLSQLLFNYQAGLETQLGTVDSQLSISEFGDTHSTYDLSLSVQASDTELEFVWHFSEALFNSATIQHFAQAFEFVLAQLPSLLNERCDQINFVALNEVNKANVTPWLEQVSRTLDNLADEVVVADCKTMLTGKQLKQKASALSVLITKTVPHGSAVAVCVEKSAHSLVGLLATQLAGCVYVPVDPALPVDRQVHIINDAQVKLILSDTPESEQLSSSAHINMACYEAFESSSNWSLSNPFETSYYLYTSGSTGKPKGVAIEQTALSVFLHAAALRLGDAPFNVLSVTTSSFDISILEMLLPLYAGGYVYLANSQEVELGKQVMALCQDKAVNFIQTTPSRWQAWLATELTDLSGIKLLTGGEALGQTLAQQLCSLSEHVYNCYGPTEATIWSMISPLSQVPNEVFITNTLENYQHQVVSSSMALQPKGAKGELVICGEALAREYVNLAPLTDEKFVRLQGAQRGYKTGDLVQQVGSDSYRFLGRLDNQIKLRGYRIELGEIETVLVQSHCVSEVAVKVIEQNLVCYFNQQTARNVEQLKEHAKISLPSYMVPDIWVGLDAFPFNSAGKVDYRQLPKPDFNQHIKFVEAQSATEIQILEIWKSALGVADIGIEHDFFEVGGNSLLAVNIVNQINEQYDLSLSVKSIFDSPTVALQSALIDALCTKSYDIEYEEEGFL